jgi:hypothetical protein
MSEDQSRRSFLKILGVTAGASVASAPALAGFLNHPEVHKLNAEQHEFMMGYEKWMDEFIEVIRTKKTEPNNVINHSKMMALTEQAEAWKPQLTAYMKEESFALIYQASIERMKKEI